LNTEKARRLVFSAGAEKVAEKRFFGKTTGSSFYTNVWKAADSNGFHPKKVCARFTCRNFAGVWRDGHRSAQSRKENPNYCLH